SVAFFDKFHALISSLLANLAQIHERGIVVGDLSAPNLIIDAESYKVTLVDFEAASRDGANESTIIFTPGFRKAHRSLAVPTYEDDLYAVASIMVYCIFPLIGLTAVREDFFDRPLEQMLIDIGWNSSSVGRVIRGLADGSLCARQAWRLLQERPVFDLPGYKEQAVDIEAMADGFARFLLNVGRPSGYMHFPPDPFAYQTNTLSLGFGTCGVLYTLKNAGVSLDEGYLESLDKASSSLSPHDVPPGFLTGTAGIAWCLWTLGLPERAEQLMSLSNDSELTPRHHSMFYGSAGIGIANLRFYHHTGTTSYLTKAKELAQSLLDVAREDRNGIYWEESGGIHVGYGYGQSGVALFLLRLSQLTGDASLLGPARSALAYDLSRATTIEDGVLSFPRALDDPTAEQYIEEGSGGIAKVALRFGQHDVFDRLIKDCWRKYSVFAGYYYGLAGLIDVFTDGYQISGDRRYCDMARRPLSGIHQLFLLNEPDGLAIPGDGQLRITCDLTTGVAGALRAMHRFKKGALDEFLLDDLVAAQGGRMP
ncbi:MAG: protein kinase/lanthionine synthetase C family protein, partial [Nitrososphaerota archaeon]|nr:protein kinase/lanthionine synthetase C family protein [Nitrososphaerota archaeon]